MNEDGRSVPSRRSLKRLVDREATKSMPSIGMVLTLVVYRLAHSLPREHLSDLDQARKMAKLLAAVLLHFCFTGNYMQVDKPYDAVRSEQICLDGQHTWSRI